MWYFWAWIGKLVRTLECAAFAQSASPLHDCLRRDVWVHLPLCSASTHVCAACKADHLTIEIHGRLEPAFSNVTGPFSTWLARRTLPTDSAPQLRVMSAGLLTLLPI